MIISGLQTGDTTWLAAHLQNAADNETVDVVEISGTVATDIDGALAEFDALASGTLAKEGVYAAFINPPEPLSRLQYARALALIEERLGLEGQPRIVLFHEKNGREHCHVVWSRIDLERMRAIQLSFDRQKLRRCAQDLAAEFGLKLPPGLATDRGAARFNDPPRPSKAEKAMEAASGLSRDERRALITQCYWQTDNAQAFMNSLEAAGFMLARGSKRVFVVVDTAGHIHSLARQIDGAKTKDVKLRLEGLSLSLLPPVDRAKVLMLQRAAAQQDAARVHTKKQKQAQTAFERLQDIQKSRRLKLDRKWQEMKVRHWHERKVLLSHIKADSDRKITRRHWLAAGLAAYLKKIAVIRQLLELYEKKRKRSLEEYHRAMMDGLRRRHENEAAELRRRYAALKRLDARELTTFTQKFGGNISVADDNASDRWTSGSDYRAHKVSLSADDARHGNGRPVRVTELSWVHSTDPFRSNGANLTASVPQEGQPFAGFGMTISSSDSGVVPQQISAHQVQSTAMHFRVNAADVTGASMSNPSRSESHRGASFAIQRASVPLR